MLIFAIDDERPALEELHDAIAQAEKRAEIMDFETAGAALAAIREQGKKPDVVFFGHPPARYGRAEPGRTD